MLRAVTYANTKEMIRNTYSEETNLEKLQQAQVFFRDAYNYLCRFEQLCLTKESLERGFIVRVVDSAASGFVPRDFHMLHNISYRLEEIEKRLNELYLSFTNADVEKAKMYLASYFKIDCENPDNKSDCMRKFEDVLGFSYSEAIDDSSSFYMLKDLYETFLCNLDNRKTEEENWYDAVRITVQGYQYQMPAHNSLDAQINGATAKVDKSVVNVKDKAPER